MLSSTPVVGQLAALGVYLTVLGCIVCWIYGFLPSTLAQNWRGKNQSPDDRIPTDLSPARNWKATRLENLKNKQNPTSKIHLIHPSSIFLPKKHGRFQVSRTNFRSGKINYAQPNDHQNVQVSFLALCKHLPIATPGGFVCCLQKTLSFITMQASKPLCFLLPKTKSHPQHDAEKKTPPGVSNQGPAEKGKRMKKVIGRSESQQASVYLPTVTFMKRWKRIRNKMLCQIPKQESKWYRTRGMWDDVFERTVYFDQHMKHHNQVADLHYGMVFLGTQNTHAVYRQLWAEHTVRNEARM